VETRRPAQDASGATSVMVVTASVVVVGASVVAVGASVVVVTVSVVVGAESANHSAAQYARPHATNRPRPFMYVSACTHESSKPIEGSGGSSTSPEQSRGAREGHTSLPSRPLCQLPYIGHGRVLPASLESRHASAQNWKFRHSSSMGTNFSSVTPASKKASRPRSLHSL
jgi:hypothetical protein